MKTITHKLVVDGKETQSVTSVIDSEAEFEWQAMSLAYDMHKQAGSEVSSELVEERA